jgi:hypothetical protein
MDLLPFKQIIRYHRATEAYMLTYTSQILFKLKNLLLCYVLTFFFWIYTLTEMEEIS